MADEAKLIVNGHEYPMPDSFTLGELADMEKITGQGYDLAQGGVLGTLALAFVAIKRVNPRITIDDLRNLGQDDLEITGVEESLPPPPSDDAPSVSASHSSETSEPDSEPTPDATPEPTGTPV